MADGLDAVVCFSDREAISLQNELLRRGVAVPDDVAMVSYDDETADMATVPLTAVSPARYRLGQMAAAFILERLRQRADAPQKQIKLRPTVVVRDSCGAPVRDGDLPPLLRVADRLTSPRHTSCRRVRSATTSGCWLARQCRSPRVGGDVEQSDAGPGLGMLHGADHVGLWRRPSTTVSFQSPWRTAHWDHVLPVQGARGLRVRAGQQVHAVTGRVGCDSRRRRDRRVGNPATRPPAPRPGRAERHPRASAG